VNNEDHWIELTPVFDAVMGADAVAISNAPIAAIWTPDFPLVDTYDGYARCVGNPANATNTQYTVHYAGETTMVTGKRSSCLLCNMRGC